MYSAKQSERLKDKQEKDKRKKESIKKLQGQLDNAVSMRNFNYQNNVGDVVNNFRNHNFSPNMVWSNLPASPSLAFVPSSNDMYGHASNMMHANTINASSDMARKQKENYLLNLSLQATAEAANRVSKRKREEKSDENEPPTIELFSCTEDEGSSNSDSDDSTTSKLSKDLLK